MGDKIKGLFAANGIPLLFWYTVSFCMLAITIMLCWLFYHSQSVSFEVANTRIEMVNNVYQVEQLVNILKQKEIEVEESKKKIEEMTKEFNAKIDKFNKMPNRVGPEVEPLILKPIKEDLYGPVFLKNIDDISNALEKIKQKTNPSPLQYQRIQEYE